MKRQLSIMIITLLVALTLIFNQGFAAGPETKKTPPAKEDPTPTLVSLSNQPDKDKPGSGDKPDKEKPGSNDKPGKDNPGNGDKPDKDKPGNGDKPDKDNPGNRDKPDKDKPPKDEKGSKPDKDKPKSVHFRGVIKDAGGDSVTLDGGTTLLIDGNTSIHIPTLGKDGSSADLAAGMEVTAKAVEQEDGSWLAKSIHVIPGKPTRVHHAGIVTDYQAGVSLTVQYKDGSTQDFVLTADTRILPKNAQVETGARVTVICPRDASGGPLTAAAIVVRPKK